MRLKVEVICSASSLLLLPRQPDPPEPHKGKTIFNSHFTITANLVQQIFNLLKTLNIYNTTQTFFSVYKQVD